VAKRERPRQTVISRSVPIVKPVVYVQWTHPNLNTPAERSVLLAKAYSEFFAEPLEVVSAERMMAAMASMLTNILDP